MVDNNIDIDNRKNFNVENKLVSIKQRIEKLDELYKNPNMDKLQADLLKEDQELIQKKIDHHIANDMDEDVKINNTGLRSANISMHSNNKKIKKEIIVKMNIDDTKAEFVLHGAAIEKQSTFRASIQTSSITPTKWSQDFKLKGNNLAEMNLADNIDKIGKITVGEDINKKKEFDKNRTYQMIDVFDLSKIVPPHKHEYIITAVNEDRPDRASLKAGSFFQNEGEFTMQALRSSGEWSMGLDYSEKSIHTCYLRLIRSAKRFIYIENQYFISSTKANPSEEDNVKNRVVKALFERILIAKLRKEEFKVYIFMPAMPGAEGDLSDRKGKILQYLMELQGKTIGEGEDCIMEKLKKVGIDPAEYIMFCSLRTYDYPPGNVKQANGKYLPDKSDNKKPVTGIIYIHSKVAIFSSSS